MRQNSVNAAIQIAVERRLRAESLSGFGDGNMTQESAQEPWPSELRLNPEKSALRVAFRNGVSESLPAELLRVMSPSAEVRGHSPAERKLHSGKRGVTIRKIEPVGNYAVKLDFSDGHDTGLFTWQYLYDLGPKERGVLGWLSRGDRRGRVEPRSALKACEKIAERWERPASWCPAVFPAKERVKKSKLQPSATSQRHFREGGNRFIKLEQALIWVPACAGTTLRPGFNRFADFFPTLEGVVAHN